MEFPNLMNEKGGFHRSKTYHRNPRNFPAAYSRNPQLLDQIQDGVLEGHRDLLGEFFQLKATQLNGEVFQTNLG